MDKGRSDRCKSYAYYFYVEESRLYCPRRYIVEYICCHDINYLISRFNKVKKCAVYLVKKRRKYAHPCNITWGGLKIDKIIIITEFIFTQIKTRDNNLTLSKLILSALIMSFNHK